MNKFHKKIAALRSVYNHEGLNTRSSRWTWQLFPNTLIALLMSVFVFAPIKKLVSRENAESNTMMLTNVNAALDKVGTQWFPSIEWSFDNPTYSGNPYDLVATVIFKHRESGESRTTEMFYAGGNFWKFRFTGTRVGTWTFTTASRDPDLDGLSGTVTINPNPGVAGFVTQYGNKWGWLGINKAFVPQFVMYESPSAYYNNPGKIDEDIQTFFVEHGFNAFHTRVYCRWFDINQESSDAISEPNPDRRTFEALELLITKVHAAGGVVHIWAWGDEERRQTPVRWGINGAEDKRLQRYIAARLGPFPGWTMGYGFDLFEWVSGSQLSEWHDFMHEHMGWPHYLGARSSTNSLDQLTEAMDYSSYEQHKPDYDKYVETIERRSSKPSFSEDRFRIRNEGFSKDYAMDETRRGLWNSTMAGGVANIWGNLVGSSGYFSNVYPNPEQIKTYSEFFEHRFLKDMIRDNNITDCVCLKRPSNAHYIFYKEDALSIRMDLSDMRGSQPAIVVDTKLSYKEINLGQLSPTNQDWNAPYRSDWAIAVGEFSRGSIFPDNLPPAVPQGVNISVE